MYSKAGVAPLSEHQVRRLIKGQGVSIKSGSKHAIPMSKEQMKKFERAKKAGKGMVITLDPYQQQMCGSGFFEDVRPATDFLRPLAEASRDRAIREVGRGFFEDVRPATDFLRPLAEASRDRAIREVGRGFFEDVRPVTDFLRPLAEASRDRAIHEVGRGIDSDMFEARPAVMPDYRIPRKSIRPAVIGRGFDAVAFEAAMNQGVKDIKKAAKEAKAKREALQGSGMKKRGRKRGKGFFEDLGRNITQTFQPVADVFRPNAEAEQFGKQVASELIHKGLPIAGSTLGGIGGTFATGGPLGGMAGSYAGERIGEELARETGRRTGYGVRGKGLMSEAFAMAKAKGKKMAKEAVGKAKAKAKELVNQYLDLGEKEANDLIGSGSFGGNKKKVGGAMRRKLRGKALLVA